MGRWLRTWYRRLWQRTFGAGDWQGASEEWSPKHHTAGVGESEAFVELDILDAFDRMVADLKAEPKWLADFKAKTQYLQAKVEWDHKYEQLTTDTGNYGPRELKALKVVLAIA